MGTSKTTIDSIAAVRNLKCPTYSSADTSSAELASQKNDVVELAHRSIVYIIFIQKGPSTQTTCMLHIATTSFQNPNLPRKADTPRLTEHRPHR
jgi:hypothetical protein